MKLKLPSPLQQLQSALLDKHKVELWIKRDDLIHPEISGNKWRKLELNVEKAKAQKHHTLLTFGGAFSNHLVATAATCNEQGIKSIGIVRGEEADLNNPTLSNCRNYGMKVIPVTRREYSQKNEVDYIYSLRKKLGSFYLVPEGGANFYGAMGCIQIVKEIEQPFHFICTPLGTSTTASGLLLGIKKDQKVLGFSALKGGEFHREDISHLLQYSLFEKEEIKQSLDQLELFTSYHFGGFGKVNSELISFCNSFFEQYNIPLDLLYTGKMFFGIFDLIQQEYFKRGSKIIAVHTGGLQGNQGFKDKGVQLIF